jgi:hypothetical protein
MRFMEKKGKKYLKAIIDKADIVTGLMLLIAGFTGLLLGYLFGVDSLIQVAIVLLSASVVFFIFRNRFPGSMDFFADREISNNMFLISSIIFFFLLIISALIINMDLYSRPLSFLILISAMAGLIAAQIALTNNRIHYYIILFEIIVLGILIRASVFYQFEGFIGGDPWVHANSISSIINEGYVTDQVKGYFNFPIMHILISSIHDLTGLTIRNSMFLVGVLELLSFIFIFLVVRKFFDEKVGLLSFLVLAVATYSVSLGFLIIPQALGICFLSILIYLVFLQKELKSTYKIIVYTIFIMFFLTVNILTHTINSFAALVVLSSIFVLDTFKIKILKFFKNSSQKKLTVSFTLVIFFFIFLVYYWMYSSGMIGVVGESLKWGLSSADQAPSVSTVMESFTVTAFKMLPLYLTAFLAIIGTLFTLKLKNFKTISLYGWLVLFFVFISVFLSLNSFLPARWFVYVQICLIIPIVLSIFALSKISPKKVATLFLLVTLISFVWLTGYEANAQNVNPFTPNPTSGMKYSEMNVEILNKIPSDIIVYADLGYHYPDSNKEFKDASDIFAGNEALYGIILFRKDLESNPHFTSALGGGHYSVAGLDRSFLDQMEKENRIYDSGTVIAFMGGV